MTRTYVARLETVHVRLSEAESAALDAIAEAEGRSRSDVMRRLMAEAITARQAPQQPPSTPRTARPAH